MTRSDWRQINIVFPDPHAADDVATTHLAPILTEAETRRLITAWFFVRKGCWRLRYLPTFTASGADAFLHDRLALLNHAGHLTAVIPGIYEPESHAFGGTAAMTAAHRLWHQDSHHLLAPTRIGEPTGHRELSIILCTTLMRAAGLDRYEQGDVWARVAEHRDPPHHPLVNQISGSVRRLLTVDPASLAHPGGPLATARTWIGAYATAGETLERLHHAGQLRRGIREILTHHVIFAWNRRGIPGPHQAAMATAAKALVFGPEPTLITPSGRTP